MTAPAGEKLEEVLRRVAVERALAAIDPELHGPFLVALRLLPQPADLSAIRELCNEFVARERRSK